MTTSKPQSTTEERLEPCPWCPTTRRETHETEAGTVGIIFHSEGCIFDGRQVLNPRGVKVWNTRISPASAAPVGDDLYAVINRVAKEPCRDYEWGCAKYGADESRWCVSCFARKLVAAAATAAPQVDDCDAARVQRLEAQLQGLMNSLATSQQEVERLRAGRFTPEEFQNLCHGFDEGDRTGFVAGCLEYQRKLFGKSAINSMHSDAARAAAQEIKLDADSAFAMYVPDEPTLTQWAAIIIRNCFPSAAPVDQSDDAANEAASKIAEYFNAPPSVIPAIEQIIRRCSQKNNAQTT